MLYTYIYIYIERERDTHICVSPGRRLPGAALRPEGSGPEGLLGSAPWCIY